MQYKYACTECDCFLWSNCSRVLGICPECKIPDAPSLDLEDQLIEAIKSINNFN